MNSSKNGIWVDFLFLLNSLRRKKRLSILINKKKLLIIQKAGIGDFFMLLPTLLTISNSDKTILIDLAVSQDVYQIAKRYEIFNSIRILENNLQSTFKKIISLVREILINIITPYDILFQPCSGINLVSYLLLVFTRAKLRIGFNYTGELNFFDIALNYNPKEKDVLQNAKILEYLNIYEKLFQPHIPITKKEFETANDVIRKIKNSSINKDIRKIIGIYPSTLEIYDKNSRLWEIDKFALLIDNLNSYKENYLFILFGSVNDKYYCEKILDNTKSNPNIFLSAGNYDIFENLALANQCDLIVGIDGGFMHAVNIMQIPSVIIWGPTSYKNNGYENNYTVNYLLNVECSPCYGIDSFVNCNHRKCITQIEPNSLIEIILSKIYHTE